MGIVLHVHDVRCGYGHVDVVHDISFTVSTGEVLCVLGPNGAGKTTLFKSILGLQPLHGGRVLVAGRELKTWRRREFARTVAYVPQAHAVPFPFTVGEVVLMGRTPQLGIASSPGHADRTIAHENMERLGIAYLADKPYTEVSGGERQMVLIARALTQQPTLLVMDEPTSNLDVGNEVRVLRQIRALATAGLAIMMISHAPDHAFSVATTAALLQQDGTLQVGPPEDIVTSANLTTAYGETILILANTTPDGATVRSCAPLL
jgi:iron complex transport system ATP-binding protein